MDTRHAPDGPAPPPGPPRPRAPDGPAPPPGPRVPRRLDQAMEDLQDMGLAPSLAERFVGWWKRYGLRKAIVFVVAVTLPLVRYVWLPASVSGGLAAYAESYGAELEIEDWTSDWWDIAFTAEDVTLFARGPYTEQRVFAADAVELDWSVIRGLGNAAARLRALVIGEPPPEELAHGIRVREATLHVERLLSGKWNLEDAVQTDRVDVEQLARVRLPAIDADRLRLVWVEHLPAASGGGLIEQKTASLFLDDMRLRFTDVVLPDDRRDNPTRFTMEGRTGDGRFSASGSLNLARWGTPAAAAGVQRAAFPAARAWTPTFVLSVYLENVGAAAFARLLADASLLPAAGTMTGHIKLAVGGEGVMHCEIDLQLVNVRYAANPRSSYVQARRREVERGVEDLVVNDHVVRQCQAPWQAPEFRVAKALQAEITGEAVRTAPPVVQGAAGYDRLRFVDADAEAVERYSADLSSRIGAALGGERGAAVARALAQSDAAGGGNVVTRGLGSVGRGFKRVFGGGGGGERKKTPPGR